MNDFTYKLRQFGDVEENVSFTRLTTYKAGGTAHYVVYPRSLFDLQSVLGLCTENDVEYKVFGNGSNILCSDEFYDGVIIRLNRFLNQFHYENNELVARAGCYIIALAYDAMKNNFSGLEFASGIPGTLGGCLFMNAGAYKVSMSDVVTQVQVLMGNEIVWLNNEECEFGYRSSIFQKHPEWIILAARISLKPGNKEEIQKIMNARQRRRFETQPLDMPSAGSVFRNLEEHFAWEYVDMIGYRGKSIGGACVSPKHSNFIVNTGNATGSDILNLIEEIQRQVQQQFGVELMMEVEKFNWKN
ncbi:MAG: UDP-N-acetylmuramate dehydrogenase [Erysipelotrichaceae bacterium]|nr:UDP-N-acetylmuramate dehydrogenase [Erysipelotrichaceae bacterium]